eukprot:gene33836-40939_t
MSAFTEIEETEHLIQTATFPGVKAALQAHLFKLKKAEEITQKGPAISAPAPSAPLQSSSRPAVVPGATFVPIESFSWDQGEYNSANISIFVDLEGVGEVKDRVNVSFTTGSFDLQVRDLRGKNYRLLNNNLEKDIVPEESTFVVKKNKVVLKLKKKKGEYSYEHWTALTAKKKRDEDKAASKDPSAGIMEMMKNMYEDGDENMKRIIGEAMLKSQRGEKPSAPDMSDL